MPPILAAKWALFKTLERLGSGPTQAPPHATPHRTPALCVFAATLGELNAVAPFLHEVHRRRPERPLWLLSNHGHYREGYLARFPGARFFCVDHHSRTAAAFFQRVPVELFLLAEIPLLPSDTPARLPYAWLHHARASGAAVTLINGWLYGERPACRLDKIERGLFARDQLRSFDVISVQNDVTRDWLLHLGAPASRVAVTGNLKFDATPAPAGAPLLTGRTPLIVAGSTNNLAEYHILLDAFARLKHSNPQAALIIAPRHPENTAKLDTLLTLLAQQGWHTGLRSQPAIHPPEVLVLDTLGELARAYAHCDLAFVGINHNVLEPLLHGKPVTVTPGWEPRYPSYPVYATLKAAGAITQARDGETLASHWQHQLSRPHDELARTLRGLSGATRRNLNLWRQHGWL